MKQNDEFFTRLVKEHKSTIYTVCYMFSHDEEEVNDLFQETLINMWKGIDSFREESKISTWIYRVALNTCLLQERKKKKEAKKVPLTIRLGLVDRALVMMWLEGMSYDEMGAVMGISPQNVGVKLFRIKEQLKKL